MSDDERLVHSQICEVTENEEILDPLLKKMGCRVFKLEKSLVKALIEEQSGIPLDTTWSECYQNPVRLALILNIK